MRVWAAVIAGLLLGACASAPERDPYYYNAFYAGQRSAPVHESPTRQPATDFYNKKCSKSGKHFECHYE